MKEVFEEVLRPILCIIVIIAFLISGYKVFSNEIGKLYKQTPKPVEVTAKEEKANVIEKETESEMVEVTEEIVVEKVSQVPVVTSLEQVEGEIPQGFYEDTLFIGDSRTVGLRDYGHVEGARFFANEGMSVFKLEETSVKYDDLGELNLNQLLASKTFRRIYFMIGINELGYGQDETISKYSEIVNKIESAQPEAQLVLCGNLHVTKERSDRDEIFNNTNIDGLNQRMAEIAKAKGLKYVDVNDVFDDDSNCLNTEYSNDDTHPKGKYYATWMVWLANYQDYEIY